MKNGRVVVLGDCHFPYVDRRAWDLALKVVQALKPATTIQIGDFWDSESVSSHGRTFGVKADLAHELEAVRAGWAELEQAAGGLAVVMTLGNHDIWLQRYVAKNASAVEGLIPDHKSLYGMSKRCVVVPYQESYVIGKVHYVHDAGHAGKTAAQQTLDTVGHCVVFGHTHRLSVVYDGTSDGERRFAANVGWLGRTDSIKYMSPAKTRSWQHGLVVVEYVDGMAHAQAVPFVNGKAHYSGKTYK